jgi:diaminohydroxyphosphoribosylaminopyrimidine deaminase/5-amino-6-(5-phosphoribosylamino)uracil reductase
MTTGPPAADAAFAREALELAARGRGRVSPNPLVGAVVVAAGRVVGRGFHVFEERDHAEVVALRQAGAAARGATLHVTLEPCSSHGRTPPCTEVVLAAGIARVVCCSADPDPRHRGRGLARLREAGVAVASGVLREEAVRLNAAFVRFVRARRPLVTVKLATSLDGALAAGDGSSRWLTGEGARRRVHEMRAAADAILVGAGTVRADDPRLSVRLPGGAPRAPLRVVLDPRLSAVAPGSALLAPAAADERAGAVLVLADAAVVAGEGARRAGALREAGAEVAGVPPAGGGGLDLGAALDELGRRGVQALLVEGGGVTAGRLLGAGLVDRVALHVAPLLLGGAGPRAAFAGFRAALLGDAVRLRRLAAEPAGDDLIVEAEVEGGFDPAAEAEELARCEEEAGCSPA